MANDRVNDSDILLPAEITVHHSYPDSEESDSNGDTSSLDESSGDDLMTESDQEDMECVAMYETDMIQSYIHARSVPPKVYIGTLRACQQISADDMLERMGWPHVQSVWAECHVSNALANGFPY
jgi:hypothetical protein